MVDPEIAQAHIDGPVQFVLSFIDEVTIGDMRIAWRLMDEPFRESHVQTWLWNVYGGHVSENRAVVEALRVDEPPMDEIADEFFLYEQGRWLAEFGDSRDSLGVWAEPDILGAEFERVTLIDQSQPPPPGITVEADGSWSFERGVPVAAYAFILRNTPEGLRIASRTRQLPKPGWPPTFYAPDGLEGKY